MRRGILIIAFFGIIRTAFGQTWEIGAFAGGSGYMGDLNQAKPYALSGAAMGGVLKRNLDGYWAFKLNATTGRIGADDANAGNDFQTQRNLNFSSRITEISLQTEFNFFNYFPGSLPGYGTRRATPYLFAGIGGVFFKPEGSYQGEEFLLNEYATESEDAASRYKNYALSVPYGLGLKYNVRGNWNLIGELGYRTAFSDYIDDVSGRYPDLFESDYEDIRRYLSDPSLNGGGIPGTQRGDFRKRDTYMFTGLSLTYTFVSKKCPTF